MINFKIIDFRPDRTYRATLVPRVGQIARVREVHDDEREPRNPDRKPTFQGQEKHRKEIFQKPSGTVDIIELEHDFEKLHKLEAHPVSIVPPLLQQFPTDIRREHAAK